ncbi:iron complex outermembrane receptor protein [Algoriphagus boseongensis]|uniref:Iron complex outermembrane receptor protein n=1 Tax=Algoriphagus boseongensis TaxID=1442587 RepID=A0A4R6TAH2_9BACT|nr:TonB-dependent receptor [Algoriphagus boseongensis]TDQ19189.1 iron complex outermembrane receptor protein [Algoriphagus boseongensis]
MPFYSFATMLQKAGFFILFVTVLFSFQTAHAQKCNLTLKGKILHQENDEPVEAAYIWIMENRTGAVSDQNGNFTIRDLCPGTYTIRVQFLGHKEILQTIQLTGNTLNQTFRIEEESLDLSGVEVHGHREAVQTTTAVTSLYGENLLMARGESLGESLKRVAGVTTFSTGNTIAKPVIHGLHSNRIMILNNGIRLEGQQWGAEHAPEIDPFLADEITVIKGAETVRFGPEAMGGVIMVNPPALPTSKKSLTEIHLLGSTNGRMGNISTSHTGGSDKIKGLGYRIQASGKRAGYIRSPRYYQANTGMSEYNFSSSIGYSRDKLGVEGYYSFFNTELGILRDAHTGNLSDLNEIIENGEPFLKPDFSYDISNPKQVVSHHLAKIKAHYHLNTDWKLNLQYGFQANNRQEYDRRRGDLNAKPSLDLQLFTNTVDLFLDHNFKSNWNGSFGINLIQQANSNIPGTGVTPLIPNYDMLNAGIYLMEKYLKGPLEIEAGARYDYRTVQAARYVGEELQESDLSYQNFSAFIGGLYQLSPYFSFSSNLGSAWRPPNVNELFSQGLHHGAAAVEIGDPNLNSEKSIKWVNELEFESNKALIELTGYVNRINDYIYLNPTGETFVSLRGTFNVYEYLQADALLYGFDLSGSYSFSDRLNAYMKGSIIRARNLDENNFFPFIPSDRMDWGVSYALGKSDSKNSDLITLSNLLVARQSREPDFDLAPAPPGYALINISYQKKIKLADNQFNIGLQVNNLFDTEFKEYMNRFRYFTSDMGRNISLKLNYQF